LRFLATTTGGGGQINQLVVLRSLRLTQPAAEALDDDGVMMDRAIAQRPVSGSPLDVAASQIGQGCFNGVNRETADALDAGQSEQSENALAALASVVISRASVAQALVPVLDMLADRSPFSFLPRGRVRVFQSALDSRESASVLFGLATRH
jgi:hypothetical protein